MNIKPSRRRPVGRAWGSRQMRNPSQGDGRYDPNDEELKTGLARKEGGVTNVNVFAAQETPTGVVDGMNDEFTLNHTPQTNSLNLFVDGVLQTNPADYTIAGNIITFAIPPTIGQVLFASYLY